LEQYFDQQIQATKRAGSSPCPGEEVCQQIGPLARYTDQPIEAICGACPKKGTKPGSQPRRLADHIAEAMTLDEIKAAGGVFPYPDSLGPFQWVGLRALERSRQKERDRLNQQQSQQSEQSRLETRLARG
jgi:hypothetical protein